MADRRPPGDPRHVSDIITDMADNPDTPPHVRDSLKREPYHYHPGCPCGRCMRAYLMSLDGGEDAA